MSDVIPPAFAFRFAFPVPRVEKLPRRGKRLLNLDESCRLTHPGAGLDFKPSNVDVRAGWNDNGIGLSAEISGKEHPPVSNPDRPDETDGIQFWLNTRSTRTIHRANRLCHTFCLLPNGDGKDGLSPLVRQLPIARASEDAPIFPPDAFRSASQTTADGYRVEAWIPANCLNGFDPEESPQLGFYWMLRDSEIGDRTLTVDTAFPFVGDPSLWQLLELSASTAE